MAEQKPEGRADQRAEPRVEEVLLLKDKQARILLSLTIKDRDWYLSSLAKATDTTYVHACTFISACDTKGITTSERHGKIKVIKLTEKGNQLAELVAGVYGLLNQQQQKEKDAPKAEKKE